MEDDEDDLYGENGTTHEEQNDQSATPAQAMEESDEEEDMDEADSDSDVEIVTERPAGEESAAAIAQVTETGPRASAAIPIIAPTSQQSQVQQAPLVAVPGGTDQTTAPPLTLESGLGFPGVHSSTVDVNVNPVYGPNGKPITEIEIDVDLIEHEKPWRRPGSDQSDWFNYGFDEFSWSTYCMRQKNMADTIVEQRAENAQFESMFGAGPGGAGAGGMPGAAGMMPPGMPPGMIGGAAAAATNPMAAMGAPGMAMPNEQEFQMAMMEAMRQQGVSDPSQVDFNAFMAQLQGGAAMKQQQQSMGGGGGGQNYDQGNWQGGGGNNFQGGNRGGYGRGKRGQRY